MSGVTPLVECGRRLVILQVLQNGTVYNDLMVLYLAPNHTERVVGCMLVDLHLRQTL